MVATVTHKETVSHASTSPQDSTSLTWTAGSRGLVFLTAANSGGTPSGFTVDGGTEVWASVATARDYGFRRLMNVFMSDKTPDNGVLTITVSSGGTLDGMICPVCELTDFDTGLVSSYKTADRASGGGALINSGTFTSIGTNDVLAWVVGHESASDGLALESGTQVALTEGVGGVRSVIVGTTTTDVNPGATWDTDSFSAGLIALYIEGVAGGGSAALSGTVTASIDEDDINTGGKTIILTLTDDTWVAAGTGPIGSTADTQAIIDGIDSAQSEANGWDAVVKVGIETADVARTSSTVCTITLDAEATYDITAQETITATIPAVALVTSSSEIVASPTFTVDTVATGLDFMWRRRWN